MGLHEELARAGEGLDVPLGDEDVVARELSAVRHEARLMLAAAQRQQFTQAHRSFASMTARCMQCHQVWRSYGRLPKRKEELWPDLAPEGRVLP